MTDNLKVSQFINKDQTITYCKLDDTIATAKTLMLLNDFSQIPVVNDEGKIDGCVSWKSIGKTEALCDNMKFVQDYIEDPIILKEKEIFLKHIKTIAHNDYVLVVNSKNILKGIITTYDMTLYFDDFITPYLKLGIIEDSLRKIIINKIKPKLQKDINDFIFNEYRQLIEKDENWAKIGLRNLDKKVFIEKLDHIRKIRNKVAHYKPTPLTREEHFILDSFADIIEKVSS
jgi:CBS domain-containing protein